MLLWVCRALSASSHPFQIEISLQSHVFFLNFKFFATFQLLLFLFLSTSVFRPLRSLTWFIRLRKTFLYTLVTFWFLSRLWLQQQSESWLFLIASFLIPTILTVQNWHSANSKKISSTLEQHSCRIIFPQLIPNCP